MKKPRQMSSDAAEREIGLDTGRRAFLRQAGVYGLTSLAAIGGAALLAGCGKQPDGGQEAAGSANQALSSGGAADPCNDLAALNSTELTTRATFKYVPRSPDPDKPCETCNFWQPAPDGEICGGCTLVKGPIHPLGTCMSWVVKPQT